MSITEYRRKRDFRTSPEPAGGERAADPSGPADFTVQKHDASRLHYDLRLPIGEVLASWAVPKGPSPNPSDRRLAVQVEDHPRSYGDFEGVIPSGYGAGTVLLWDRGACAFRGNPERGLARGRLSFTLHGEKLRGDWTLVRMDGEDRQWLLIKQDDEEAAPDDSILRTRPRSVRSGRTLKEIEAAPDADTWEDEQHVVDPAEIPGSRPGSLPERRSPQLCTLVDRAPDGDEWLHEIKLDGYRLLAFRRGERVRLRTRSGKDWTDRFPVIAEAVAELPVDPLLLDGEACVLDTEGRTSFQDLQRAITGRGNATVVYEVFDLLYAGGRDLTESPLEERKQALGRLLTAAAAGGPLRACDHVVGDGSRVHEEACRLGLEGIVSKRRDGPSTPRRSRSWLKIKCIRRQEFVVIGWTPPSGSRRHFGALLLAAWDDDRLVYTGKVGTGFDESTLRDLRERLEDLARATCPADEPPPRTEARGARWVAPELVAEVTFTEWTRDRRLRHPSFVGLREDKPVKDVRIEVPRRTPAVTGGGKDDATMTDDSPGPTRSTDSTPSPSATTRNRRGRAAHVTVAGVRISNPDRVLFPESGLTKRGLAEYYAAVADRMLPHVRSRPLSTLRCPRGRTGKCFFQKHPRETLGDPIRSIRVPEKGGTAEMIAIDSAEGLVSLAQFGVIELHPWGATEGALDTPDLLTFDLDPGEGVDWAAIPPAARRVRDELEVVGLRSFVKLSGGKGVHVVVPLAPRAGWDQTKAFCRALAVRIARQEPQRFVATMSKARRRGRIFIDYLRNAPGATSIAPYSVRARPGAPVAVPIRWDELGRVDGGAHATVDRLPRRLAQLRREPWDEFDEQRRTQSLTDERLAAFGAD